MAVQPDHATLLNALTVLTDALSEVKSEVKTIHAQGRDRDDVLRGIRDDIAETKEVVQAWVAVKTGGKFLIWFGKVLVGAALVIAAFKGGLVAFLTMGGK